MAEAGRIVAGVVQKEAGKAVKAGSNFVKRKMSMNFGPRRKRRVHPYRPFGKSGYNRGRKVFMSRTGGPPTSTWVKPIRTRFWKGKKSKKMRALYKTMAIPRVWQSVDGQAVTGEHGRQIAFWHRGLDVASAMTLRGCIQASDAAALNHPDDAIYIRNHSRKFEMTNHSNSLITVKIYTFLARHDRLDGLTDNILNIWISGLDAQIGVNSNASWQDIGQEPLRVPTIGNYYKLFKKQEVKMSPGGQHTHYSSENIGKWISYHRLQADNANRGINAGVYGGITTFTLFVMFGQPARPDGSNDDEDVTTTEGALDIIATNRFSYHYLNSRDWLPYGDYYNNLDLDPIALEVVDDVDQNLEHNA